MPANVDERIVAAKFDSSDFEKGVDKTVKKLDELKKSLNLKDAGESVAELADKTKKATESAEKSLDKLTERFTTFTGMIKQRILGGFADEVAGVFLRMEQSIRGFIRSISSDQVGNGMAKYEQMLTSVRVMMSAGDSQKNAYAAIERLQEYSDQTSYSLSQMTDALSKMRAAGVDLDTATKSVEGIANACANAGVNAQEAYRAFYNLSQAYSSGVLKYTDYRSLELLNMTTAEFKTQIMEAAVAAGTLKKVSDGVYQTINKTDKKVVSGKKVTDKNLTDALKYNFVNTDVMNKLFGEKFFFDEQALTKLMEEMGLDKNNADHRKKALEEAKKQFGETAVNAYLAAREARSFTDVLNTLKDVVSTGWSTTFQHLFGKLEEAKEFFTDLAEGELAQAIYNIGEWRNEILEFWNPLDALGRGSGGVMFRQTILNITDSIGVFVQTLESIAPDAGETGRSLFELTIKLRDMSRKVKDAADEFKKWMESPIMEDGPTRIELIRKTMMNLGTVFSVAGRLVVLAFESIAKVLDTLSPVFDGVMIALEKLTEPIAALRSADAPFKNITYSVDNLLTVIEKIAEPLGTIVGFLGEIGAFFVSMAIDTVTMNLQFFADVIEFLVQIFTGSSAQKLETGEGILERMQNDFNAIKDACTSGLGAVKEFFGALLGDIKELFGLTEEAEKDNKDDQEGGIFSRLIKFFETNQFIIDAKAWVDKAIVDVGNFIKSIPDRVMKFGENIYNVLWGLFFTTEKTGEGSEAENKTVLTPLGEWMDQAIKDIKEFFANLPNKIIEGVGKVGSWIDSIFDHWFGTGAKEEKKDQKKAETETDPAQMSRFDEFVQNTIASIKAWFEDLPNKIQSAMKGVGDFISNLVRAVDEFLFGKKLRKVDPKNKAHIASEKTVYVRYKKGFSAWLDKFLKDIKLFIKKLPEYIKSGIKNTTDLISLIVKAIFGKDENEKQPDNKTVEERLKAPFLGINLTSIVDTIKDIGKTLLTNIAKIFTGTDDVEENAKWFSGIVAEGITWIRTKAEEAFAWVLEFLPTIPSRIATFFSGNAETDEEANPVGKAILEFAGSIGLFILEIPEKLQGFFNTAIEELGKLWDRLTGATKEAAEDATNETNKLVEEKAGMPDPNAKPTEQKSKWQQFVEKLGTTIASVFEELPVWIANGIDNAVKAIDDVIAKLGTWLQSLSVEKEVEDSAEETAETITKGTTESVEKAEGEEEPALLAAVKRIAESIKKLLITTIPAAISSAWKFISGKASGAWEGLSRIFAGTPETEFEAAIVEFAKHIGIKIRDTFASIPTWIVTGINSAIWTINHLVDSFAEKMIKIGANVAISDASGKALKGIGEQISGQVKTGLSDTAESVEQAQEDEEPALLKAVKGLGTQIQRLFTETLPTFINGAWTEISKWGSGAWTEIKNIFAGTPETEFGKAIHDFAIQVGDFITKEFPEAIKNAFESVKKFVSGLFKSENPADLIKMDEETGLVDVDSYKQYLKAKNDKLKGETSKSGFWTFIDSMKESLKQGFLSIGPAILEGLAKALDWIGNIGVVIADLLTGKTSVGDELEKAYGEETPELKSALARIGESVKKFFLETIPTFLNAAIKTLLEDAPKFFGTLFGGLGTAAAESADTALESAKNDSEYWQGWGSDQGGSGEAEGFVGGIQKIIDIFSNVLTSDLTKTVALILAMAYLVSALKNLFSVADTIEATAAPLKWGAILVAVSFIGSLLKTFGDIVNEGNPEKISKMESLLDKLGGILTTVAWITTAFSAKELFGAAGDIWGGGQKFENKPSFKDNILSGIGGMFGQFFEMIGLGAGTSITVKFLGAAVDDTVNTVTDALETITAGVNQMLDFIAPFIQGLVDLHDKVDTATDTIKKVSGMFTTMYTEFRNIFANATGENLLSINGDATLDTMAESSLTTMTNAAINADAFAAELDKLVTPFYKLAATMDRITDVVVKFDNEFSIFKAEGQIENLLKTVRSAKFKTLLVSMFNVISEAYSESNIQPGEFTGLDSDGGFIVYQEMGLALGMLSDALSVFTTSISGLTEDKVDALRQTVEFFRELSGAIGDKPLTDYSLGKKFGSDSSLSASGRQIKIFGSYMKDFYEYVIKIPGFDSNTVEKTKAQISSVVEVAEGMARASATLHNVGTGDLDVIGEKLPTFGYNIGYMVTRFNEAIGGTMTTDQIQKVATAVNAIANVFQSLSLFNGGSDNVFFDTVNRLYNGLNEENTYDKLAASFALLGKVFIKSLTSEDQLSEFQEAGSTIAHALYTGIQSALDNPDEKLQPTIRPVLDLTQAKSELRSFLGLGADETVNFGMLASTVAGANANTDTAVVTYTDQLNRIESQLQNITENSVSVGDVTNAFSKMKIVLDTGVMAGGLANGIDRNLGLKLWLLGRGNAVSDNP